MPLKDTLISVGILTAIVISIYARRSGQSMKEVLSDLWESIKPERGER